MARITLIGPNQLASNPRLVRNADALAAAGHQVTVVYPDHLPRFRGNDEALSRAARWQSRPVDFCVRPLGRLRGRWARARRKLAASGPADRASAFRLERAYGYFGPELAAAAARTRPELIVAQQQVCLAPAARAAAAGGARFAVDVEDLVAESSDEPVALAAAAERAFFPRAAFLATMSEAAADRLAAQDALAGPPVVLHNCMSLAERAGLRPPEERRPEGPLRLYWFGQTVGPHACAEAVLRAIARAQVRAVLTLRGANPLSDYLQRLRGLAAELGLEPGALRVEPGAPPAEMVRLASEHDICLGTQPSREPFHQLAIGNKVFTGMMAGCAAVLTDTEAHRRLLAGADGWACLFGHNDPDLLAGELRRLAAEPPRLAALRRRAWDLAGTRFNWESESRRLLAAVDSALRPS